MALRPGLAPGLPLSPIRGDGLEPAHGSPTPRSKIRLEQTRTGCYRTSVTELLTLSRPTGGSLDKPSRPCYTRRVDEELVDPEEAARRRKSALLLIAGGCSLALPLLGVGYVRWRESSSIPRQAASTTVFQPREGVKRVTLPPTPAVAASVALATVVTTPVPPPAAGRGAALAAAPQAGPAKGSLGFIKPSADYFKEKPAAAPRPAPKKEAAEPPAKAPPKAAARKARTKPGKKPFLKPKLNPGKGFTNFKSRRQPGPPPEDGGDMSDMLQSLPPGAANNPELQKYLQGR